MLRLVTGILYCGMVSYLLIIFFICSSHRMNLHETLEEPSNLLFGRLRSLSISFYNRNFYECILSMQNDFIIILKITNEGNSFKIEKTNNLAIL